MNKTPIKAVIFDMDGLMFDTELIFLRGYQAACAQMNLPDGARLWIETMGVTGKDEVLAIDRFYGKTGIGEQLLPLVLRYREQELAANPAVTPMPGLFELLEFLAQKKIPMAVASSSSYEKISDHLSVTGTAKYIQAVVSGEMVAHTKPSPDIFLLASEMLGISPENCLVLEDSPNGILAASRAGMLPVMIPQIVQPDEKTEQLLFAKCSRLDAVIQLLD